MLEPGGNACLPISSCMCEHATSILCIWGLVPSGQWCVLGWQMVSCVHLCLMLLNLNSWAMERAAGVVSSHWSLMLGPLSTIFTRASRRGGKDSFWHSAWNPVKDLASPNKWLCTICAALAKWTASLSLLASQTLANVPMSSSNAVRTSHPFLWACK